MFKVVTKIDERDVENLELREVVNILSEGSRRLPRRGPDGMPTRG